jgi:uncharacterized protein YqiB (DUF1249 family)
MRMQWYPWSLRYQLGGAPTVGWLMDLCDENYYHLIKLAPKLRTLKGQHCSRVNDDMDLYLEVLEQTPYTSLIHLTYYFKHVEGQYPDPDAILRVYYDAKQVEIMDLKQCSLPMDKKVHCGTLNQKWKANLFLSKWLAYCALQGHHFDGYTPDDKYRVY